MTKFSLPTRKGKDPKPEPQDVDPAALQAFAAGAREKSLEIEETAEYPWSKFDPKEAPKYNVSVRLNDYHLEMLRYVAETLENSQQRILRKHLIPVIERLAEEAFEQSNVK
jgi:hypothetical protein